MNNRISIDVLGLTCNNDVNAVYDNAPSKPAAPVPLDQALTVESEKNDVNCNIVISPKPELILANATPKYFDIYFFVSNQFTITS